MSLVGVDRVLKYAFELARRRERKHVTSATKSNGISITMPYWDSAWRRWRHKYPTSPGTSSISTSYRAFRAASRLVRRGCGLEPVRRYPLDLRSRLHSYDRHCAVGQHQPGKPLSPRFSNLSTARPPTLAGQGNRQRIGQIWSGAMDAHSSGEREARSRRSCRNRAGFSRKKPCERAIWAEMPITGDFCGKAVEEAI